MQEEEQSYMKFRNQRLQKFWRGRNYLKEQLKSIEKVEGFKYPLKIVVAVKNDIITVVTNYPLKKGIAR